MKREDQVAKLAIVSNDKDIHVGKYQELKWLRDNNG
jgi:hypothetical protein